MDGVVILILMGAVFVFAGAKQGFLSVLFVISSSLTMACIRILKSSCSTIKKCALFVAIIMLSCSALFFLWEFLGSFLD